MILSIAFPRGFPLVLMMAVLVGGVAAWETEVKPTMSAKRKPPPHTDIYGDPLPPGALALLGTIRLRPIHEVNFLVALPDGKRLLTIATKFEGNTENGDTGHL